MDLDAFEVLAASAREAVGTDVRITRHYDAPPVQVWSAITETDRIERWLGPVSGDLAPGGRFQVEGNAGGEVTACEPPHRLELTWEVGDHVGRVEVTLTGPEDGPTRLDLVHHVPSPPEHWEEFGPGAVGIGWELGLWGLRLHLDDPSAPRPGPDELPDLTGLMADLGRAWGEAAVAGGADPGWARAAARRCVAAYTGGPAETAAEPELEG